MKRVYLIVLYFIFSTTKLLAQGSCATAVEDLLQFNVPLPAIGTVAPAGPDYGSLDILTRPFWGYLMSCDSTSIALQYDLSAVDPSALFGFVFWGPFHSKTDACNNLTASNIYLIKDSISYGGPFGFSPGLLHTGSGELFIYMLTTNDTTPNNNLISSSFGMQNGFGGNSYQCYLCNDEVSQLLWRNICLITFDSLSQKTKLVWEKRVDAGVGGYVIYRSASMSGPMDSVGFVPESMPGEFIDLTSSPLQYQENYKMMPVDSCGNHYTLWEYYYARTLFLQTTPAGNNSANLNWSTYGIGGVGVNQFEPVVYIHRGSTPATMQIIDTIPAGVSSYTDIFSPPGQQYYALEHRRFTPCDPLRTSANSSFSSIFSNPSGVTITGLPVITEENFSIHPVPADQELIVFFNEKMIGSKFYVIDMSGKTIISSPVIREKYQIDVSGLAPNTYWLSVVGASKSVRKFVVSR